MQPRGGWTHPALSNPGGWSLLRTPAWTLIQKQPPRQPVEVDDSPPPSGDSDETPETVDWSQPAEGDL